VRLAGPAHDPLEGTIALKVQTMMVREGELRYVNEMITAE
jgi:hypothetical protein